MGRKASLGPRASGRIPENAVQDGVLRFLLFQGLCEPGVRQADQSRKKKSRQVALAGFHFFPDSLCRADEVTKNLWTCQDKSASF